GTPIRIALPGGRRLPGRALRTTPFQVATELGAGLAEAALVARVNGTLQDLDRPLECDTDLELLDFSTPEGREAFWHSSACVLGAVAEQFFGATLCSAQATEDGFFCDVHMGSRTVQSAELPALEEACAAFARARHRFERLEATRQQLAELLKHNSFQLEQLEEVTSPTATVYRCGPLLQLCRGPLLRHTGLIGALRVLTVGVGRGSPVPGPADVPPIHRLWAGGPQCPAPLMSPPYTGCGPGVPVPGPADVPPIHRLWAGAPPLSLSPQSEYRARGFSEVVTPNLFSPRLWELSGHWQHYSPHIFSVPAAPESLSLKPMNCPAHCLMFAHRPRSWRELPLRLADFGVLHRNEPPGTLTGLTRVRRFQQDDAHIFCMLEQLESEIDSSLDFIRTVYAVLGFSFRLVLATRPDGFLGDPETWDRAEQGLWGGGSPKGAKQDPSGTPAPLYSPQIDIQIRDALGRQHQCGTIQLDFQMPERFELEYA
ncbi:SYTC protein, partial [Falcunculus frontatus]|nr:SYTC protein [Falcunculus frontatus]